MIYDSSHERKCSMVTVFNRKELLQTYDLRQMNDLRELLRANRIDHSVKVSYPRSSFGTSESRPRTASFGPNRRQEQYIVYVRKADWEYAVYLLKNN